MSQSLETIVSLSPHAPPSGRRRRLSSNEKLTKALQLAQKAVNLDSSNDNPQSALIAYSSSIALLNEVLEQLERRSGRGGRRAATEDETRKLRSIVDSYQERSQLLIQTSAPNISICTVQQLSPTVVTVEERVPQQGLLVRSRL